LGVFSLSLGGGRGSGGTVGAPEKLICLWYRADMARIYINELKKPKKQIAGFHLRNYGWSSKKTISNRRIALMLALRDVEDPKMMKDRMLHISQWNKKMCYDTYMFWDDLSYGDMWYLEHACKLAEALKKC
jgi:hypothetical protein